MASDRARNYKDMADRVLTFDGAHNTVYVAYAEAATQYATITTARDALEGFLATQTSGDASMAVEQKSLLILAAKRRIKAYSTAAKKALKYANPGIEKPSECRSTTRRSRSWRVAARL